MLLRARTVLPACSPPIEDGGVFVRNGRIEAVGRFREVRRPHHDEFLDLGDSILLPGLINAHCHLDYTDMVGKLSPGKSFSDWIKAIVALKAGWSYTEFARSWLNGAKMLLRSGTTTVVDIEAVPEMLSDVAASTPLRLLSCLELLSLRMRPSAKRLVDDAVEQMRSMRAPWAGLSPHAPYSTSPELLKASATAAREHGWLLTTHVAESGDEFQMYTQGAGAMYRWLKPQRDMSDCGLGSPIQHLDRHGVLGRNFLAVHANFLAQGDAELIGRSRSSVVHCPRSHTFFGHPDFPFEQFERAKVNICLGTDSMASIGKSRTEPLGLDLFAEMRVMAKEFPGLTPERLLQMVTLNAAEALDRRGELGCIAPRACADLIAIPGHNGDDPYETVLNHRGEIMASLIRGDWAIPPDGKVAVRSV